MKENRVMILTTHSMEEADALSDRIAVLSKGQLKCIGTPLYLKNHYGEGYRYYSFFLFTLRLSLTCEEEKLELLKELMQA